MAEVAAPRTRRCSPALFYRDEIAEYYRANGLPEPYEDTARRKIVPETLEQRVLAAFMRAPRPGDNSVIA